MTKDMTTLASYAMKIKVSLYQREFLLGVIRFRYAEMWFQPSIQPAVFTVLFPEQYDVRRDSGPGAQWMAPDLHDKMKNSRHIVLSFDGSRRGSGLGAAAWILWLRDEYGTFEEVSYGGRVLRNASAMIAEREALRTGIEHLTDLFPTEVSSFDFQV